MTINWEKFAERAPAGTLVQGMRTSSLFREQASVDWYSPSDKYGLIVRHYDEWWRGRVLNDNRLVIQFEDQMGLRSCIPPVYLKYQINGEWFLLNELEVMK